MNRSIRLDAVLVQAVIAGALSFAHLHDLADAAGQDGWKAWAYPVSVDLLLVAAWRRLRTRRPVAARLVLVPDRPVRFARRQRRHRRTPRPPTPARLAARSFAGWPALAFLGGTLLAHTATRPRCTSRSGTRRQDSGRRARAPEAAPDPEPADHPVQNRPA